MLSVGADTDVQSRKGEYMAITPPSVGLADLPYRTPYAVPHTQNTPDDGAGHTAYATRGVEISVLKGDGTQSFTQTRIPAHPIFEAAFSAFGRGTMIATPGGEVAIEDLLPGDMVSTGSGGRARVEWIGACAFAKLENARRPRFVRVMSDAFGMSRPHSFVTLGQGARVLQTPLSLRGQMGPASLLTHITSFEDGDSVIPLAPPTPVQMFHIMLRRHATIRASGLECETYHPGNTALRALPRSLQNRFLSLFPQISDPSDFGPQVHPRAPDLDDSEHRAY